jgi:cleavage and polyadenylation specificity factor subunit 1
VCILSNPPPQTSPPSLAIANVSSFLVYTVGQKIYIWQFKDKDMPGLIFIDSAVYVH